MALKDGKPTAAISRYHRNKREEGITDIAWLYQNGGCGHPVSPHHTFDVKV